MKKLHAVTAAAGVALLLGGCGAGGDASANSVRAASTPSTVVNSAGSIGSMGSMESMGHGAATSASSKSTSKKKVSKHNAADVMFLQMMIARQEQTAKLTRLSSAGTLSGPAQALTDAIAGTQDDERLRMASWLEAWHEPVAMTGSPDLHAKHGGVTTLTRADLAGLRAATGSQFQLRYLNLLISQQSNAVEVARYVLQNGENAEVAELAGRIEASRTAQIRQMLGMLAG